MECNARRHERQQLRVSLSDVTRLGGRTLFDLLAGAAGRALVPLCCRASSVLDSRCAWLSVCLSACPPVRPSAWRPLWAKAEAGSECRSS